MSNYDRTGPEGQGPMTGRGLGSCAGRFRECLRRGFGFRKRQVFTKEEEKKFLEKELKEIDLEKQEIEKRLREFG